MKFRAATPDDAVTLLAQTRTGIATYTEFAPAGWTVDRASGPEHLARIRATLESSEAWALVAEEDGRCVGRVAYAPTPGAPRAHLLALFLEPERQGTGLAQTLHDRAIRSMHDRGFTTASLHTPAGNARARRFYERNGWRLHGEPQFADSFGLEMVEYRRS